MSELTQRARAAATRVLSTERDRDAETMLAMAVIDLAEQVENLEVDLNTTVALIARSKP